MLHHRAQRRARIALASTLALAAVLLAGCSSKSSECSDMYGPWYHYTSDDGGYCVHELNGARQPYPG